MMSKYVEEANSIIESLVASDHQVHYDKNQPSNKGVLELDKKNIIMVHNMLTSQQMEEVKKKMTKLQVGSNSTSVSNKL